MAEVVEVFGDLDMVGFAERLALARRRAGLTQGSVATFAELSPTHYSELEGGKQGGLRANTLYKLCMVLRVSADTLLGLKDGLS